VSVHREVSIHLVHELEYRMDLREQWHRGPKHLQIMIKIDTIRIKEQPKISSFDTHTNRHVV
jgi:hypothetical protein